MTRLALVASICILLLTLPHLADAERPRKLLTDESGSDNGIRLVGANESRGRLEISSTAPWLLRENEEIAWRPVCAVGGVFDNNLAQVMCKLMGFKFGRRYYSPDVAYQPADALPPPATYQPVGYVYCYPKNGRRRLAVGNNGDGDAGPLQEMGAGGAIVSSVLGTSSRTNLVSGHTTTLLTQHQHHQQHHARSLLAPLYGNISIPPSAPYWCQFRLGDCNYPGPFVGIECSRKRLPPAPPPPSLPPSPPRAPPLASFSIRLFGHNGRALESNLCPSWEFCMSFNRVELQVPSPGVNSSAMIWAPLCSTPLNFTFAVGQLACWQVYNWPRFASRPDFVVISEASNDGFPIPSANTTKLVPGPSDAAARTTPRAPSSPPTDQTPIFDPTGVSGWVTVTSIGNYDRALRIQDLGLSVSSKPCSLGAMFAVSCTRRSGR